jgi:hypothetical protein
MLWLFPHYEDKGWKRGGGEEGRWAETDAVVKLDLCQ